MPTYEYVCKNCNATLEVKQSITADKLITCEKCATDSLERIISKNVGLIFKGSGFYQTDYKMPPPPPTPES